MTVRDVTIHVFASTKGGVGKSTLAVAAAKLLAAAGRGVVLVDADLTGTSLMDGMRLCAPIVSTREDGSPDLKAEPTGRHMSWSVTRDLRNARKRNKSGMSGGLVLLNDVLTYGADNESGGAAEARIDSLLWRHEADDGVLYLPSSPLLDDVAIAAAWQFNTAPFTWLRRMAWFLDELVLLLPSVAHIVIDLPPGLFGFSHEMLSLMSTLAMLEAMPVGFPQWNNSAHTRWRTNPFLVTTKDFNDLIVALEYVMASRGRLPNLRAILNRCTSVHQKTVLGIISASFSLAVGESIGVELWRNRVEDGERFREIFSGGDFRIMKSDTRLLEALRLKVEA